MRAMRLTADVEIKWINSEDVTAENVAELLHDVDGVVSSRRLW